MSVAGESRAPGLADLRRLGAGVGLDARQVDAVLEEVREVVGAGAQTMKDLTRAP